jgi:Sulfotransferase family
MTLPTFLIIGAMKGGTTSLHRYLRQHPEVFMPERKELNFFVHEYVGPPIDPPEERNWSRGITWYERQFIGAERERVAGEASPNYSRYPTYPGVAERIAAVVPDVKLIYVVRNPIDRTFSHYLHDFANGREQRPLHIALRRDDRYLAPSRYATQLENYFRVFSPGQVLVLRSDDLLARRAETVSRVLEFIGVNSGVHLHLDFEAHRSSDKVRKTRTLTLARRFRYLVPRSIRGRLRQLLANPLDTSKIEIDTETRKFLTAQFAPDVRRLSELAGEDFGRRWGIDGRTR